MEHYDKEKLGFAVNETKAMLDWLNKKRDRFHELSECWRTYGDTVGYTDVQVCADAIDITADSDIHDSKIHRWADRIRKRRTNND